MENIVTNELMRALDRHMIEKIGIPGAVLMENAARDAAAAAMRAAPKGRIVVLIGPGNNGGDGLAVLRILAAHGYRAAGLMLCDSEKLTGDAALNFRIVKNLGLELTDDTTVTDGAAVIVDALFGTGFSRELTGKYADAVRRANASDAYRIAVDIPSGMNGNSGRAAGVCFKADETVTMFAIKRGLILTDMPENVGRITVSRIGLTAPEMLPALENEKLIDEAFVRSLLPQRKKVTNKGSYGRALIAAGSAGMPGAAVMAARACIRGGAGLTKVFVPERIIPAFSRLPEAMLITDEGNGSFEKALSWATAVGFGCGSGNDPDKRSKLAMVLSCGKNAVIDADGLNAMDGELKALLCRNHILTPHPGEMARLTGLSINDVTADPVGIASGFAKAHGCYVALKNAATVIASPDGRIRYNNSGCPALAKGGSGDVLTGLITALLAQGLEPFDAAAAGCYILGASAEKAVGLLGERFVTAGDVSGSFADILGLQGI